MSDAFHDRFSMDNSTRREASEPWSCPEVSALECLEPSCAQVFSCAALDLVFTDGVLPPDISLVRGTQAGYVDASGRWVIAAHNQPRFDHDSETLAMRGLLVEGPSRNLLPWSHDLEHWLEDGASVTPSSSEHAPDGSPAWMLTAAGGGFHTIELNSEVTSAPAITLSVFVKPLQPDHGFMLRFYLTDHWSLTLVYDIASNTLTTSGAGGHSSSRLTAFPGGWWRIGFTFTLGPKTVDNEAVLVSLGAAPIPGKEAAFALDGEPSFAVWGVQLEAQPTFTSLIPTSGAPADRAGDVVTITRGGWFTTQGTLLAELWPWWPYWDETGDQAVLVGTAPDQLQLLINRSSRWLGIHGSSLIELMGPAENLWSGRNPQRTLLRYGKESWKLFEAGTERDKSEGLETLSVTSFRLGSGAAQPLIGHLRRISFWDGQVTDHVATTLAP